MHDLAVVIISTNEAHWLEPCLTTLYEHAGDIELDVVIADNESTDGTRELVESKFPQARVVRCANHGFAHGNNRGLMATDARYVLFLNPDTEVVDGTLEDLLRVMDASPEVGLAGVRQLDPDRNLFPTARRFPSVLRAFGEAFFYERLPVKPSWLGERELDLSMYETEFDCDWTSGSCMLARREAIESGGFMDERFFLYAEETDFCLRIKRAGWTIRHLPALTIVHHFGKAGVNPKLEAQGAYARRQYARKNFPPPRRALYLAAVGLRYGIRWGAFGVLRRNEPAAREPFRRALRSLVGIEPPPFTEPPEQAVRIREADEVRRMATSVRS
jgi:N-acetylglucosaminyl-diphospho-decaprenol L-rhamnosyltransferase